MTTRDKLLKICDEGNETDYIVFVKKCVSLNDACLSETLNSCSRKQLDHIWLQTFTLFANKLVTGSQKHGSNTEERKEIVQCIVPLLSAMLAQTEIYVPDAVLQVACSLEAILPELPSDDLKNSISQVFEKWWKKDLPYKHSLIITSFVYLVERSLDLQPKPLVSDVARVWSLHEVMSIIELQDESSQEFKLLLKRCFISSQYLQHDEGVKFLSYVMSQDEKFMLDLHSVIKNHLLSVPRFWVGRFGEIYFRAWQNVTGTHKVKMEQCCLQDLMFHAVHAKPALAPILRKLVGYFHHKKKHIGVDNMLCTLYDPIIWRSLAVANSQVRANTAALFFDVFPLQNQDLDVQYSDAYLQKQFDMFQELLDDPFPNIRSLAVQHIFIVMQKYWEMIPLDTLKNLMFKLVQDRLCETSSAAVRESVIKGLTILLDNNLSHIFLKTVLPAIAHSFDDVSQKVRVAMLDLLLKVKTLRTITYWSIIPIEHLLARLVVDEDPVNKRIMKLIFDSFVPLEKLYEVQLERCITLIQSNHAAARQFYKYMPQQMSFTDIVNYVLMLCKAVLLAIKNTSTTDIIEEIENDTQVGDVSALHINNKEPLCASNTTLMLALLEVICILWSVIDNQVKKDSDEHLLKDMQKKFSYALGEMIKAFDDPKILCVINQITGFLPPDYIPSSLSRMWLPKLRNTTNENCEEDYGIMLEMLCLTSRAPDIIELALEWLESVKAEGKNTSDAGTKKKGGKKVCFLEQKPPQPQVALKFLMYIFRHSVTQSILLRDHMPVMSTVCSTLKDFTVNNTEMFLTGQLQPSDRCNVTFLTDAFTLYCKLCMLLKSQNKEYDSKPEFLTLLSWTDKHVLPILAVKTETPEGSITDERKDLAFHIVDSLLLAFNNMFLVGIGDTEQCTALVDFCLSYLSADGDHLKLLPTVMLCLYQVTEFLNYYSKDGIEIDVTACVKIIPTALSRIFVNIAIYVKHNPNDSGILLETVKPHVLELLTVVFSHKTLSYTLHNDTMTTAMSAILAELAFFSQQVDLSDEPTIGNLPPLSKWLVGIICKKANIFLFFIKELTDWCKSWATDINRLHGIVHLLSSLANSRPNFKALKELWILVNTNLVEFLNELNKEDKQRYKDVIISAENKMKACQTLLNIT